MFWQYVHFRGPNFTEMFINFRHNICPNYKKQDKVQLKNSWFLWFPCGQWHWKEWYRKCWSSWRKGADRKLPIGESWAPEYKRINLDHWILALFFQCGDHVVEIHVIEQAHLQTFEFVIWIWVLVMVASIVGSIDGIYRVNSQNAQSKERVIFDQVEVSRDGWTCIREVLNYVTLTI